MRPIDIAVKKRQRGNYIIEFGISFMVFFVILLGILDVARGIYTYSFLAGAAKEMTRYAMVHGSSSGSKAAASDVKTVVQNWLIGVVTPTSATVTTTWSPTSENPGSVVTVAVQYTYTPITNFLVGNWSLQTTLTIGSRATAPRVPRCSTISSSRISSRRATRSFHCSRAPASSITRFFRTPFRTPGTWPLRAARVRATIMS